MAATRRFSSVDGPAIQQNGVAMAKKRNPVYLLRQDEDFIVKTNEGEMGGHAGGHVAYDPLSGHVWPVSADYVDLHYEPF